MNSDKFTKKTNFEKIREFHNAFGLDNHDNHQLNIFDNKKLIKLRLDLISEEFEELKKAIKERDFTETRDAIGDILYVVYGAAASFGIDADSDYDIIHNAFGLDNHDNHQLNIFDNKKLIKDRLNLISKEFEELKKAIKEKNFTKIRDAIGDILYVVYETAASFGIDADSDYDIIHDSNMTKLCRTEEEAKKTVSSYKQKFKDKTSPYDTPDYKKADDGVHYIVYNKSTGKVLKSINYTPVKFI